MRVAVLMSSCNGEKYIKEQIESILGQTGSFDLDLWVRDDGSSDSTQSILKEYESQGRLRWYTGENLRAPHSFMDLVLKCKDYDYYAFADQDDYWMPNKLQVGIRTLSHADNTKPALYFANAELVDSKLDSLGRNVYMSTPRTDFQTLCCAGGYLGCTIVYNNTLAKVLQSKPMPGEIVMHDFHVALVCSVLGGSIFFDPNPYMKYRQHGNNVIGVAKGTIVGRLKEINRRHPVGIAEQVSTVLKLYESEIEPSKAKWMKKVGNYKKNVLTRISLAISKKTKYMNKNTGLRIRLSILLGNR